MDKFELALKIIDAIGSVSAAIGIVIALNKFSKKLKVVGEFPVRNRGTYLLSIYNDTVYDNEIKSITFFKGNPQSSRTESSAFWSLYFNDFDLPKSANTKNIFVEKGGCVEIPIPCKLIVKNYDIIGEAMGKPFDKIYISICDKNGRYYYISTNENIDYFRLIGR